MTQYPNYPNNPNDPTLGYAAPPQSPRPTSVTVLGIIGIVLSALALICTPVAFIPYVTNMGAGDPTIDTVKNDPALYAWVITSLVLSILLAFVEMAGSVGSLMLKPWARTTMIYWAWASVVLGILGTILTLVWMMPKVMQASVNQAAAWGGMIGGFIGGVVGLVFPIFVLIYFKRDYVKAAFERGGTGQPPQHAYTPPPRVPY